MMEKLTKINIYIDYMWQMDNIANIIFAGVMEKKLDCGTWKY